MPKTQDMPPFWVFPSATPGKVMVCYWNAADKAYNKGCREIDRNALPTNLGAAVTRIQNAVQKYDID